jgi:pyruvate formate lyase activating enzyme
MLISAIQKFTLIDYPGKVACVVFTPGCNFRCGYCHNPEFVEPEKIEQVRSSFIPEAVFFNFLSRRQRLLDGVVITGGEPTIMYDLVEFIRRIKGLGLAIKLDTNGSNPDKIKALIAEKLIDYIAMDIKTSLEKYPEVAGPVTQPEAVAETIALIKNGGIPYEFRATILKELHPREVLEKMADLVVGAERFYLQTFRPQNTLDAKFASYQPYAKEEMEQLAREIFANRVKEVGVR